jgi:ADP-dependent NAD(P)H-hydrate dehydratase / NAD(P)H-hydrate epimerase
MSAFDAECECVSLHWVAAAAIGPGLIAEDLSERLPQVYARLIANLSTQ